MSGPPGFGGFSNHGIGKQFVPTMIAAVAAGYWWDRSIYSGLGTAGFRIPERNGNATFDLVQATVGAQPIAGVGYLRYPATLGHDATAGAVAEGWTTKTTVCQWRRWPNNIVLTASKTVPLISHYGGGGARRFMLGGVTNAGATLRQIRGIYSNDGSSVAQYFWSPTFDTDWHFDRWTIDTTLTGTLRMRYWLDRIEQSAVAPPSGGTPLFNGLAPIESAGNAALSVITPDTVDLGNSYIFPGEPTADEETLLMGYNSPKV